MFILDTNVLSEEMKLHPNAGVHDWFRNQPTVSLFTTVVTETEIRQGIALLPDGLRKQELSAAAERVFALFGRCILPFDRAAVPMFVEIVTSRQRLGRPIGLFDAQIAAIAKAHSMSVATRDVRGFADIDLSLVDPWI